MSEPVMLVNGPWKGKRLHMDNPESGTLSFSVAGSETGRYVLKLELDRPLYLNPITELEWRKIK